MANPTSFCVAGVLAKHPPARHYARLNGLLPDQPVLENYEHRHGATLAGRALVSLPEVGRKTLQGTRLDVRHYIVGVRSGTRSGLLPCRCLPDAYSSGYCVGRTVGQFAECSSGRRDPPSHLDQLSVCNAVRRRTYVTDRASQLALVAVCQ